MLGAEYGYRLLWVLTLATAAAAGFELLAGNLAATLFGLVGAALLAAAIVPPAALPRARCSPL